MATEFTIREQVIEVVNRLFIYTDNLKWKELQEEVFAPEVLFDMSSAGAGAPKTYRSEEICSMWQKGFEGIHSVHHQAGNYLVTLKDVDNAQLYCYAIALHYKQHASKGDIRQFVGSYDINLKRSETGWRISSFKYNLKYITGNIDLK